MIILKWIGDNKNLFIPGFPARDLELVDLENKLSHGGLADTLPGLKAQLIKTGLYAAVAKKRKKVSE